MMENLRIAHLETLRNDTRDEIKRRIEQRDKFSIQLTISLGAILAVSFSIETLNKVMIAAPLVSIYFTMLILYSYKVHGILAKYLRCVIEPQLACLCGIEVEAEWENYYKKHQHQVPGIRARFFVVAMWVVTGLSLLYVWDNIECTIVIIAAIIYALAVLFITCYFRDVLCPKNKPNETSHSSQTPTT